MSIIGKSDDATLRPQLSMFDAVATGLAAILGAGIFAVIAPAAEIAPFTTAVAVSSFRTLIYYTVTNTSALKLPAKQRRFPRGLAFAGLMGC